MLTAALGLQVQIYSFQEDRGAADVPAAGISTALSFWDAGSREREEAP